MSLARNAKKKYQKASKILRAPIWNKLQKPMSL